MLGGETYSEGLGVLANSSISLNLNGQYTQFESTIGVDGYSNTGSSVIFDVYGNGQLLYQSPTVKYTNGAAFPSTSTSPVSRSSRSRSCQGLAVTAASTMPTGRRRG